MQSSRCHAGSCGKRSCGKRFSLDVIRVAALPRSLIAMFVADVVRVAAPPRSLIAMFVARVIDPSCASPLQGCRKEFDERQMSRP